MISSAVSIIECSVLFVDVLKALFSIINPKIKGAFYYAFVFLPLSLLFFAQAVRATNVNNEESVDD